MNRAPGREGSGYADAAMSGDRDWTMRMPPGAGAPAERDGVPEPADASREYAAFAYYHRLRKVKEHVERALADDISLASAARVAGLEAKYFSSYFRQKTGRCFKHWLAERRIEKAKHMMRSGDYTISEVAYAVGFRDLRTFERTFKKCTGVTPRTYRGSVRPA